MFFVKKLIKETDFLQFATIVINLVGFILLLLITLKRNEPVFWDEEWYLRNVTLLKSHGISKEFLLKYWGPAGPLYAVLHFLLEPFTNLAAPGVRVTNVVLLGITTLFLWLTAKEIGTKKAFAKVLSFFSIPMIYVCGGMALTEVPAMLFATIAVWLLFLSINVTSTKFKVLFGLLGGVVLSFAILGRQPYLVITLASLIFLIRPANFRANIVFIAPFVIGSLLLPALVFNIWGNIQPPIEEHTGKGLSPFHAFLALGYASMVLFLITPSWFYVPRMKYIIYGLVLLLLILLLNQFILGFEFMPMKGVVSKFLTASQLVQLAKLFASGIIIIGVYFCISSIIRLYFSSINISKLFLMLCVFLLLGTSLKITHQFSSRYVAQAAPFLVLMVLPYIKFNLLRVVGTVVGITLGILSLNSFFSL